MDNKQLDEIVSMTSLENCAYMTSPIGMLPINSHGLRLAVDEIALLKAENERLKKRGKWTTKRTLEHDGEPYCSICGEEPYRKSDFNLPPYCPNCGAAMGSEVEDGQN